MTETGSETETGMGAGAVTGKETGTERRTGTDELIRRLASEPALPRRLSVEVRLALAVACGLVVVVLPVLATLGLRSDLVASLATAGGGLKVFGALALAAAAFRVACRAARPGTRPLCPVAALLAGTTAAWSLLALGLGGAGLPVADVVSAALPCVAAVTALALLPAGLALAALTQGAPASPALAGGAAGLLSGALAAGGYALFCPLDDPLYVVAAYGTALAVVTLLGAAAGRRVLAW